MLKILILIILIILILIILITKKVSKKKSYQKIKEYFVKNKNQILNLFKNFTLLILISQVVFYFKNKFFCNNNNNNNNNFKIKAEENLEENLEESLKENLNQKNNNNNNNLLLKKKIILANYEILEGLEIINNFAKYFETAKFYQKEMFDFFEEEEVLDQLNKLTSQDLNNLNYLNTNELEIMFKNYIHLLKNIKITLKKVMESCIEEKEILEKKKRIQ